MQIHATTRVENPGDIPLWVIAVIGLGSAVALGWGRFAYGLLLPAMQHALAWSYATAGSLATANGLGYLLGAVLAGPIVKRLGLQSTFFAGMACVAGSLFGCALVASLPAWLVLQASMGFGGALVFVIGAILVANGAATRQRAAIGLAIYVAGAGFGIALAAVSIPLLLILTNSAGWRWAWVMLAAFSAISFMAMIAVRHRFAGSASQTSERLTWRRFARLGPVALAYGLFGLGYIGYVTFITTLLHQQGLSRVQMSFVWIVLGLAAMVAVFVWGRVLPKLRNGYGLAAVLLVVMAGVALPLLGGGVLVALLSVLLVGGSMLAAPPAMAHFIRDALPRQYWVSAMGLMTVCFGIGQMMGPVLVGRLADSSGGIATGLDLSAAILGLGLIVALCQRSPVEHAEI